MQTNDGDNLPQRGALLVTVTPSTALITAGSSFSIAINITNPFDVPVTINSISTQLPVELYDVLRLNQILKQQNYRNRIEALRYDLLKQLGSKALPKTQPSRTKLLSEELAADLFKGLASVSPYANLITAIAEPVFRETIAVARNAQTNDPLSASTIAKIIDNAEKVLDPAKEKDKDSLTESQIQTKVNEIIRPLEQEFENTLNKTASQETLLQPGNSTTQIFVIKTKQNLRFKPATYNLHILLSYQVDGQNHSQSLPHSLSIQASLTATMAGAVVGALLGVTASNPAISTWTFPTMAPKIISALVLSVFAIIAFARKEGVQPVLAIQDFWGGALIGFLVGYSGVQVLGNIFSIPQSSA